MVHKGVSLAIVLLLSLIAFSAVADAARLPEVGNDGGQWGTILNDYLTQEHQENGVHGAITAHNITFIPENNNSTLIYTNPSVFIGKLINYLVNDVPRFVVDANGNIGIGTSNPAATIHITNTNGDAEIRMNSSAGADSLISFYENGTDKWSIRNDGDGSDILTVTSGSVSNMLSLTQGGSIGIGTTAPDANAKLHISTDGVWGDIFHDMYDNTDPIKSGALTFRRARGNMTSPAPVLLDDRLGMVGFRGYDSTGFSTSQDAAINVRAAEAFTSTAHGTYITFETKNTSSTTRTEKVRITANGSVGIGTTNPGAKLHLIGDLWLSGNLNISSSFQNITTINGFIRDVNYLTFNDPGPDEGILWQDASGNTANATRLVATEDEDGVQNSAAKSTTHLHLFAGIGKKVVLHNDSRVMGGLSVDGNIGIGTTSPSTKLEIDEGAIRINTTGMSSTKLANISWHSTTDRWSIGYDGSLANDPFFVNNGTSNILTLLGTGNIGIGTNAPGANLHLNSSGQTILRVESSGNTVTDLYSNTDGTFRIAKSGVADILKINLSAGGDTIVIGGSGNVGIGTSTPNSTLHVPDGKYAQFQDNNAGAPPAGDCDNDNERGRMSIDTSNNRLYICNGATRGWDYAALTD